MAAARFGEETVASPPPLTLSIGGPAGRAAGAGRKRVLEAEPLLGGVREAKASMKRTSRPSTVVFRMAVPEVKDEVTRAGRLIERAALEMGPAIRIPAQTSHFARNNEDFFPSQLRSSRDMQGMTLKGRVEETVRFSPARFAVEGKETVFANVIRIICEHEKSLQKELGEVIYKKLQECKDASDFFTIKGDIDSAFQTIQQLRVDASPLNELIEPLWEEAKDLVSRSTYLGQKEAELQQCQELIHQRVRLMEEAQGQIKVKKEMLENDLKCWDTHMNEVMEKL